jgi:hypothetical protein
MPNALQPIPVKTQIVAPTTGAITLFFRQAWEALRAAIATVPTIGSGIDLTNQSAALAGTLLQTVTTAGKYRVSYYIRKTVADGVSSSVGFVWHWTESGVPQTLTDTLLATDTTGAVASNEKLLDVDANTNLTLDVSYASNTPAKMRYRIAVRVEQMN